MTVDKDDSTPNSPTNGANEASEEEPEYEIEAIIDAKRGMFPHGRVGFFVKWKGYGDNENSWVDENDAGNAEDLIKDFWSRKKNRKQETKTKRGRKSTATMDEESDDLGSVSVAPKKKGRKPKARTDTEEIEETDTRVSKKDDDQDVVMSDMGNYDSWPSWEDLIRSIDTIEKDDSGKIQVYFTLKSGAKVRESSENCRK